MSEIEYQTIDFIGDNHQKIVTLHIEDENNGKISIIDKTKAEENGESWFQLKETCEYEFYVQKHNLDLDLKKVNFTTTLNGDFIKIHESSRKVENPEIINGRIKTQSYVGTVAIFLNFQNKPLTPSIFIEVRSKKIEYRSHYRVMIEDLTNKATDLILSLPSVIYQNLIPAINDDPVTLIQQFYFLKSILSSSDFVEGINRIIYQPHTSQQTVIVSRSSNKKMKVNRSILLQIASKQPRVELNSHHPLSSQGVNSIPSKFTLTEYEDTLNNYENQFIKYTLIGYLDLLFEIQRLFEKRSPGTIIYNELSSLIAKIEEYLHQTFFSEVSRIDRIDFSSITLQKKQGYRTLLQSWIKFNLASIIIWSNNEDTFQAGKKDIATLYEYWAFFELLDILENHLNFSLEPYYEDKILKLSGSHLDLILRSGKDFFIDGWLNTDNKRINVRYFYNKTYSKRSLDKSWSLMMRPDYTLAFWTGDTSFEQIVRINEEKVSAALKIKFLHFDAKYKLDTLKDVFGDEDEEISKKGDSKAKRQDLLKMHTYKDAIHRSIGSYVIYPGSSEKQYEEYSEIIPGIGAFPLLPQKSKTHKNMIRAFLKKVISSI